MTQNNSNQNTGNANERESAKQKENQTNQMAQNLESKSSNPSPDNSMKPDGGNMPTQAYKNASIQKEQRIKYIREQMEFKREQQRKNFERS